jgi:hypothetical protein
VGISQGSLRVVVEYAVADASCRPGFARVRMGGFWSNHILQPKGEGRGAIGVAPTCLEGSPGLAAQRGSVRSTAIARQMAADLSTSLLAVFLSIWSRKAKPTIFREPFSSIGKKEVLPVAK